MTETATVAPDELDPPTLRPAWLSGVDADELAELTLVGVTLGDGGIERPHSDAALDAQVSELLRKKGEIDAELMRYQTAMQYEIDRIRMRYQRVAEPTMKRATFYDGAIKQLAEIAVFSGKSKSRAVGYGKYGRTFSAATVKITDAAKAVAFAKAQKEPTEGVLWKKKSEEVPIAAGFKDLFKTTGEVPDGCVDVKEADTPWYEVHNAQ